MGQLRPTSSVTLRRSVPSLDVYISDLQRRVCYLCRERILRQLAPRAFAISSPSAWNCLPVDLRDPGHSLLTFRRKLKTHLFNLSVCSLIFLVILFWWFIFWLTSMLWPAVHDTSSWLFSCLRTASSFWDNFSKSLFDNNNHLNVQFLPRLITGMDGCFHNVDN